MSMQQQEAVPDLLRRFAPTPYSADVVLEGIALTVQTNDPQIITEMQTGRSQEINLQFPRAMLVRVVRDHDAPVQNSEITMLSAGPLVTLLVGTGTTIALDCDRREVLGFLSSAVSPERLVRELLPILLKRFSSFAVRERQGKATAAV
jgi:hypothetical protein